MKTNVFIAMGLAVVLLTAWTGESKSYASSKSESMITLTTALSVGEVIRLTIDANEGDRAFVWIDLNNNGRKDEGEAVIGFGENAETEYLLGAQTVTIHGNVTGLWCYDNSLTALDISKNRNLTELSCDYNQLTALNLSNNTLLTALSCGSNELTALDVSKNTKLEYIYCYENHLTALDVSSNTSLNTLVCWGNRLTLLDVSKNKELTALSCNDNRIAGENMTVLLNSLPDRNGMEAGELKIISPLSNEQNRVDDAQKAIVIKKNWNLNH